MIIQKPEKRRHYYVSQVQTKKLRTYTIHFEDCRVVNVATLPDDAGYTLNMWVAGSEALRQVETAVFDAVCANQVEWFNTDMPTDKLSEYFRSCLDANNVCQVTVSNIKPPRIQFNGNDVDDFADVATKNIRELRKLDCRCVVEVSGVYFYPKKFGIKLNLKNITLGSLNVATNEPVYSPCKEEVEREWDCEVKDLAEQLLRDEEEVRAKIERIRSVKRDAELFLAKAKGQPECSNEWNENLEALRSLIFRYRTGSLL